MVKTATISEYECDDRTEFTFHRSKRAAISHARQSEKEAKLSDPIDWEGHVWCFNFAGKTRFEIVQLVGNVVKFGANLRHLETVALFKCVDRTWQYVGKSTVKNGLPTTDPGLVWHKTWLKV